MDQGRDKKGKFASKGDEKREVRTIRLTDSTWKKLGKIADERGVTRADLIEEMMTTNSKPTESANIQQVIEILESALKLKANAGGAIKEKIKGVLEKLKI